MYCLVVTHALIVSVIFYNKQSIIQHGPFAVIPVTGCCARSNRNVRPCRFLNQNDCVSVTLHGELLVKVLWDAMQTNYIVL